MNIKHQVKIRTSLLMILIKFSPILPVFWVRLLSIVGGNRCTDSTSSTHPAWTFWDSHRLHDLQIRPAKRRWEAIKRGIGLYFMINGPLLHRSRLTHSSRRIVLFFCPLPLWQFLLLRFDVFDEVGVVLRRFTVVGKFGCKKLFTYATKEPINRLNQWNSCKKKKDQNRLLIFTTQGHLSRGLFFIF